MATSRSPKGPQPTLGGSDAAFKPFTDAAAASSSKSATAVDISDAKQTKEAAAVKQAVLKAISLQLKDTYRKANPSRPVGCDVAPRRVLTHPSIPVANGGADNELGDLIVAVSDMIGTPSGERLEILGHLGRGTFGQVLKVRTPADSVFALKVIRNRQAFRRQAETEVELLKRLRLPKAEKGKGPPKGDARSLVVQLHDHFLYRGHLCLLFEPLGVNLLQLLQQNQCTGLSCSLIRYFSKQLLQVLALLRELGICHCDLKPENILLQNLHSPAIKLIDFGSACYATRPLHTYIQSRFYRSPEVMLGCQYGTQIDMWSFGAIVGELFLGLPLFPGETEYNQMHRIVKMRGVPPEELLLTAPLAKRFFERVDENGNSAVPAAAPAPAAAEAPAPAAAAASSGTGGVWRLRSEESFCREHGGSPCRNKQYFKYATLPELVAHHPPPKSANGGSRPAEGSAEALAEKERRMAMLHFCEGLLQILPSSRWTPLQSLRHPFITGEPFTGTFSPPPQEATTTTAASSSSSPAATAPAKAEERTSSSSSGSPATTTASEPAKPQCNISISPASPPQSAREEAAATTSAKPAPAPPSAAPATASTTVDKPAAPAPPPAAVQAPAPTSAAPTPPQQRQTEGSRSRMSSADLGQQYQLSPPPPVRPAEKIGISVPCGGGGGGGPSCSSSCNSAQCANASSCGGGAAGPSPPNQPPPAWAGGPPALMVGTVVYQASPPPYHSSPPAGMPTAGVAGGMQPGFYSASPPAPQWAPTFCASPPGALSPESMATFSSFMMGHQGAAQLSSSPPNMGQPGGHQAPHGMAYHHPAHGPPHGQRQLIFPSGPPPSGPQPIYSQPGAGPQPVYSQPIPGAQQAAYVPMGSSPPGAILHGVSPPTRCFVTMDGQQYMEASTMAEYAAHGGDPNAEAYAAHAAAYQSGGWPDQSGVSCAGGGPGQEGYHTGSGEYSAYSGDGSYDEAGQQAQAMMAQQSVQGPHGYYGADGQWYPGVAPQQQTYMQPPPPPQGPPPYYAQHPGGVGHAPPMRIAVGVGMQQGGGNNGEYAQQAGSWQGMQMQPGQQQGMQQQQGGGGGGGRSRSGSGSSGRSERRRSRSNSGNQQNKQQGQGGPPGQGGGGGGGGSGDKSNTATSGEASPRSPVEGSPKTTRNADGTNKPGGTGEKGLQLSFDDVFA